MPAMKGRKRCFLHGGRNFGPKGYSPRSLIHGRYSRAALAERKRATAERRKALKEINAAIEEADAMIARAKRASSPERRAQLVDMRALRAQGQQRRKVVPRPSPEQRKKIEANKLAKQKGRDEVAARERRICAKVQAITDEALGFPNAPLRSEFPDIANIMDKLERAYCLAVAKELPLAMVAVRGLRGRLAAHSKPSPNPSKT
jgi:hypothetical protein